MTLKGRKMMLEVTTDWYLTLSAILFSIGFFGMMIRKNALIMFMCIELMLNAVNLTFISASKHFGQIDGQIAVFFVLVVAAAEVVVGLAIIVSIFRKQSSASVDVLNILTVLGFTTLTKYGEPSDNVVSI